MINAQLPYEFYAIEESFKSTQRTFFVVVSHFFSAVGLGFDLVSYFPDLLYTNIEHVFRYILHYR